MADQAIMIPQHLAPLVALMDGTREVDSLPAALSLRTGVSLTTAQVREFVAAMDSALLLENGAFKQAAAKRLKAYRDAPFRKPSHADLVYPSVVLLPVPLKIRTQIQERRGQDALCAKEEYDQ